ncbi:Uncharacterised protein [Corynebacterium renale]|uniref:hypothetical protein n=1 Tax=Corynebacterium renale TaxID=1724 RepID=UPI000DA26E93|nr:hypothetical protein [Corynebacterium renale]SQG64458.1 Uncharacterised protein [Corynebacterium renale]STC95327.1 Uncharacterised protein [Corynebacterium renale]
MAQHNDDTDNVIYADFGKRTRVPKPPAPEQRDSREVAGEQGDGEETPNLRQVKTSRDVYSGVDFARLVAAGKVKPNERKQQRGRITFQPAGERLFNLVTSQTDQGRIGRGRSYAADGRVLGLQILLGRIEAQVAGSQNEPFHVALNLPYRDASDIERITRTIAELPNGLARAEHGELPPELLDLLLGDEATDVTTACDCPDPTIVCKHAVAVADVAAQRMSTDPHVVFSLRGLDISQLEESLTRAAESIGQEAAASRGERFWAGRPFPSLPNPKVSPAIEESDIDLLHKAMRLVSYTSVEQLRAVADIEELYDVLTGQDS